MDLFFLGLDPPPDLIPIVEIVEKMPWKLARKLGSN
jgi:hypothetical protein